MTEQRYTVFDTEWGFCGLAWTDKGLCALVLPERKQGLVKGRLQEFWPHASPGDQQEVAEYVELIRAYFRGEPVELTARLDLSWATPFQYRIYKTMTGIPAGETWSYGHLAAIAGAGSARAVGTANARNRIPLFVPCHRVVKANGELGGFSASGGTGMKQKLLDLERQSLMP